MQKRMEKALQDANAAHWLS